jgi:hypothetical protein
VLFASPLWLLALLPWLAVVLYLLWGRRPRVDVPFLELWPAPGDDAVRVRRRATPPPVALALAILATFFGIMAASRPAIPRPGGGQRVSVVLDRGYTMSARGGTGGTRLSELFAHASPLLPGASIESVPPAGQEPTAMDTRGLLNVAVRRALSRDTDGVVAVLSDQTIEASDQRLIRITPERAVRNARIVFTSARESPAAQVMVRLRAGAGLSDAKLRVTSGGQFAERAVTLPTTGERDEFMNLPRFGQTIKAELLIDDDHPADNTMWLARDATWPRLEARAPLPPHLQRMVEVYTRRRPPGEGSRTLVIVPSVEQLSPRETGVVVPPVVGGGAPEAGEQQASDHPVTRGFTWSDVGSPAVSRDGPPAGWTPVQSSGGKVWVAVREQPARAVWVGFDTSAWARSSDFVVFWANVFNWAGAGGERFASYPVGTELEGNWSVAELAGSVTPPEPRLWPGLYRRGDETLCAIHTPDVPFPLPTATNWRERLATLRDDPAGRSDVGPLLACLAVVCLCGAALTWKPRSTPVKTGQT